MLKCTLSNVPRNSWFTHMFWCTLSNVPRNGWWTHMSECTLSNVPCNGWWTHMSECTLSNVPCNTCTSSGLNNYVNVQGREQMYILTCPPTRNHISLRMRTVWLESPLSVLRHCVFLAIKNAPCEDSDQTVQMHMLNWIIAGPTFSDDVAQIYCILWTNNYRARKQAYIILTPLNPTFIK